MFTIETTGPFTELQALSHLYGRDIEVYLETNGLIPNEIYVTPNGLTNHEPIKLLQVE